MRRNYMLCLALLLSACSTIGNRQLENAETVDKIRAGKSTKAEVKALVGDPSEVTFTENGEETWKYVLTKSQVRGASFIPIVGLFAGGADIQTYTLTVLFRTDGVVKQYGRGKTTGGSGSLSDK